MSEVKTNRIGEENINKQGLKMWIKEYRVYDDIDVEFEDGFISYNKRYSNFIKGGIRNRNHKAYKPKGIGLVDRTGEVEYNHYGSKMTVVEYNNAMNMIVEFENGYRVKCAYGDFKKRKIINPYDKMVCGVAYIGEGKYVCSNNKIDTKEYSVWYGIIKRCYNEEKQKDSHCRTYVDCSVCDEWLNFQNFAKWYEENYYEVDKEKMHIDKDILYKNNKIYSPETCIIVPENINKMFIKEVARRGNLPIGVSISKSTGRYRARVKKVIDGVSKEVHLGHYSTPEQAFNVYKAEKEKHIKKVANDYKDKIPEKLYIAMINYKVEITD